MRKIMSIAVAASLATLLVAPNLMAEGEVYRWKDANNVWHYSDQPQPGAELVKKGNMRWATVRNTGNRNPHIPKAIPALAQAGLAPAANARKAPSPDAPSHAAIAMQVMCSRCSARRVAMRVSVSATAIQPATAAASPATSRKGSTSDTQTTSQPPASNRKAGT